MCRMFHVQRTAVLVCVIPGDSACDVCLDHIHRERVSSALGSMERSKAMKSIEYRSLHMCDIQTRSHSDHDSWSN